MTFRVWWRVCARWERTWRKQGVSREVAAGLRALGTDTSDVEVKSAAAGMPDSINTVLSALANLPGGGTLLLGLDEGDRFRPVGLSDAGGLMRQLATRGRGFAPPVRFSGLEAVEFEGAVVVVAAVAECDPSAKPCRTQGGKAYLRSFDGNYEMSHLEEQAFLSARGTPTFDRRAVAGTQVEDLDAEQIDVWRQGLAASGSRLSGFTGQELLLKAGIADADGIPTVAGLLSFGRYPQQWFPRFVINAGVEPGDDESATLRMLGHRVIDGPIPMMLDQAMAWAGQAFPRDIRQDPLTGVVTDQPRFPLIAFREAISNALVHRDLDRWSQGLAVEARLTRAGALVVTSPGGLYGITVSRLGRGHVTSARNPVLVKLCETLHTPAGARVIEGLATGIPLIRSSLRAAGLPPARFHDSGVRFTVLLEPRSAAAESSGVFTGSGSAKAVWDALSAGPLSAAMIARQSGLTEPNVRRILRRLRDRGHVRQDGGPGRPTTYRRSGAARGR